ncbi:hypothetical protein ISCGN_029724 [Ixodes scapularis]
MGKCFVPNCKSGYKSCKEKFSLFKPPVHAEKLAAWRRAIPREDRVLSLKDLVCERHFAPHFVVKTWSAEFNGHLLMQGDRRATLAKDAVPSVFDGCSAYLTKQVKPPRKPAKRKANTSELPAKSRRVSPGDGESTQSAAGAVVSHDNLPEDDDNTPESSRKNRNGTAELAPSAFDVLFESAQSARLPEPSWAVHRLDMEGIGDVVYSKIAVKQDSVAPTLYISKAVHIKSDRSVNVLLLGKSVKPASVAISATVTTLSDVEQAVNAVKAIKNSKLKREHWIADIAKRRIDILVHPTVLDEKYWQLLHFPRVFFYRRIEFHAVRKLSRRAGAFIRKAPMAYFTILFLSMVTCAIGFCVINYCSGRGLVNGIQDVVLVLVSTTMLFSYRVPERFQRVLAGRIVLFCWMAGGFQLGVYFQGLLTSSLSSGYVWDADDTIEKLHPRLTSGKVLPCVLKGSYFDRLLLQSDETQGIIGAMAAARRRSPNKNSTVCHTFKECMKKVLGGSHVFLSHEKHGCFVVKHDNRLTFGKDAIHQ